MDCIICFSLDRWFISVRKYVIKKEKSNRIAGGPSCAISKGFPECSLSSYLLDFSKIQNNSEAILVFKLNF
jgi:hypothetical protein